MHRSQATAQDSLHNYAETLQGQYIACTAAAGPNYISALTNAMGNATVPPGFSAPTETVQYWTPPGAPSGTWYFGNGCPTAGDTGLQQVTLTLVSTSGKVSESLVVDLRSQL